MSDQEYPELAAIATLLKTLEPLKEEERARVVNFVFQKLGIDMPAPFSGSDTTEQSTELAKTLGTQLDTTRKSSTEFSDIRSLRVAKNPRTASQMVALVAYYLEHLAPEGERRNFITAEDIRPYFNQARFELPSAPPAMTLTHAKNAGYLNALARGQYRLNPVGHNLVAYKLPGGAEEVKNVRKARKKRKQKPAKKKAGKRA